MDDTTVFLREQPSGGWILFSPKGHPISGIHYLKGRMKAEEWGRKFISTWPQWKLIVEEYPNVKENKFFTTNV